MPKPNALELHQTLSIFAQKSNRDLTLSSCRWVLIDKLLGFLGQPPNHKLDMTGLEPGPQFRVVIVSTKVCFRQKGFGWHCKPYWVRKNDFRKEKQVQLPIISKQT